MQVKTRFLTSNSDENNVMLLCFSDLQLLNQKPVLGKQCLSRIEYLTMKMRCVVANQQLMQLQLWGFAFVSLFSPEFILGWFF